MTVSADVLIIGGGAIGLATAWRLARRGVSVTVIDRGALAGEASSHAAGMLAPITEASTPGPFLDLAMAGAARYPAFVGELKERTGVDPEYGQAGAIHLAVDDEGAAAIERTASWLQALSIQAEMLDGPSVRLRERNVTPRVRGGLYVPSEGSVTTPRLAEALAKAAAGARVRLLPWHSLAGVERQGNKAMAVRLVGPEADRLIAGRFLIAAGPWSAAVGNLFGVKIPVLPVRGQLIALDGDEAPIKHILLGGGIYLVRWQSGDLIVGSTEEHAGFVKETTAAGIAGLLNAAIGLVPMLADRAVRRTWACLRPGTPDRLPILGRVPGLDNVFVATGHFRNGILLTPITADLMADTILGRTPSISLDPFRLDRPGL
jgi:glycine oxidase